MGIEDFEEATQEFERTQAYALAVVKNGDEAAVERLAELSPLEYGRLRKEEAERLGVPVSFLDREIKGRQKTSTAAANGLNLTDFEPAADPVDGQQLMDLVTMTIKRYVVMSEEALDAVALWLVRAHAHDLFDVNPRLALLSPEKACGKTTVLELLERLTPRSLMASNISPAAVFRIIEAERPTLLMDEMDSFSDTHEELRGILNSGHRRAGAKVVKTVGDAHEVKTFSTWCPMVAARIGRLPDTLEDRSVIIHMQRRKRGESVTPLRWTGSKGKALYGTLHELGRGLARWVQDHESALVACEPTLLPELGNRAADNWFSLLAIADVLGGDWPERARKAAKALSCQGITDSDSDGLQLLADIRDLFTDSKSDSLSSYDLCNQLTALEERSWGEWRYGKALSPSQLAKLLRPFGVRSRTIRLPERVLKGYQKADFHDAFTRYLTSPEESSFQPVTPVTNRSSSGDEPLFEAVTREGCNVSGNGVSPAPSAGCNAVTAPNREMGERGDVPDEKAAYLVPTVAGTQDNQGVIEL